MPVLNSSVNWNKKRSAIFTVNTRLILFYFQTQELMAIQKLEQTAKQPLD